MGDDKFYKARLEMLSNQYGTFNGEFTFPNYNRESKRKYIKKHKKDKDATLCPHCKQRTIKIIDDNGKEFCELCGKLVEFKEIGTIFDEEVN